jgi:hypothetical protein
LQLLEPVVVAVEDAGGTGLALVNLRHQFVQIVEIMADLAALRGNSGCIVTRESVDGAATVSQLSNLHALVSAPVRLDMRHTTSSAALVRPPWPPRQPPGRAGRASGVLDQLVLTCPMRSPCHRSHLGSAKIPP